jgi:hypothetical protein
MDRQMFLVNDVDAVGRDIGSVGAVDMLLPYGSD